MKSNTLIALTGVKGSGKDTAALSLIKIGYKHLAFADPLKLICKEVFHLSDEEMNDPILKETTLLRYPFKTPRYILKTVGTECFRDFFPGVWVEALKLKIKNEKKVVITDLRFFDEAIAIRNIGGTIIRIIRPSLKNNKDTHISETQMKDISTNYVLFNDKTKTDLQNQLLTLVQSL